MPSLSEPERRDFWEMCEDRYQVRSTILTSQLPVSRVARTDRRSHAGRRHPRRLMHHAHRMEMRGDSMRKKSGEAESKLISLVRKEAPIGKISSECAVFQDFSAS
jgi:DNA replication protein DnaC